MPQRGRKPEILLVDDRVRSVTTIVRAFERDGWLVHTERYLLEGVQALNRLNLTAAIFDLRLQPPSPDDRLGLEAEMVPLAWVDTVDEFSLGTVLGRYVVERMHDTLPFVYISALDRTKSDQAGSQTKIDRPVIDKVVARREQTLGSIVLREIRLLLSKQGAVEGDD